MFYQCTHTQVFAPEPSLPPFLPSLYHCFQLAPALSSICVIPMCAYIYMPHDVHRTLIYLSFLSGFISLESSGSIYTGAAETGVESGSRVRLLGEWVVWSVGGWLWGKHCGGGCVWSCTGSPRAARLQANCVAELRRRRDVALQQFVSAWRHGRDPRPPAMRKTRTHNASDTEPWRACSGDPDVDDAKAPATTTTLTRDQTTSVAIWMVTSEQRYDMRKRGGECDDDGDGDPRCTDDNDNGRSCASVAVKMAIGCEGLCSTGLSWC